MVTDNRYATATTDPDPHTNREPKSEFPTTFAQTITPFAAENKHDQMTSVFKDVTSDMCWKHWLSAGVVGATCLHQSCRSTRSDRCRGRRTTRRWAARRGATRYRTQSGRTAHSWTARSGTTSSADSSPMSAPCWLKSPAAGRTRPTAKTTVSRTGARPCHPTGRYISGTRGPIYKISYDLS